MLPGWAGARHWLSPLQEWLRPLRPVSVSSVIITARFQLGYSFLSASWKSGTITFFWRIWNIITKQQWSSTSSKQQGSYFTLTKNGIVCPKSDLWSYTLCLLHLYSNDHDSAMLYFMLMFIYAFLLIIYYSTRCVVNHFSIHNCKNSKGKY